jgi:serine/threonine-protein kinase
MEYLDGLTLRSYCEAATRPSEQQLMFWMLALLDALVHMHPKESQLRRLRAESRTEETLQQLLESRYGYVHRDIKPENVIVTSRGPVLVDFNISSRVSVAVETVSATPGYLPPELIGTSWSPRIDIHQLGVTMLQVAAGESLVDGNHSDLVLVMRATVSPKTAVFIERLMDTSASGYQTAYTARRDAQRILNQLAG